MLIQGIQRGQGIENWTLARLGFYREWILPNKCRGQLLEVSHKCGFTMIFLPIRVYYIMRKKWIARLSGIVINWRGSHPFLVSCFFFFIFYISFLLSSSPAYYPSVWAQPLIFFHGYVHFSECTELTVWIIKLARMEAMKGKYGRLRIEAMGMNGSWFIFLFVEKLAQINKHTKHEEQSSEK